MSIFVYKRKLLANGGVVMGGGSSGGSSGGGTATTQGISSYAQPEVNSLLGAAMNQVFTTTPGTGGYDQYGNPVSGGAYTSSGSLATPTITGMQPYQPYSTNPSNYVAGFSPLQEQSFNTAANLQVTPQLGQATNQALNAGANYASQATNPAAVQAYMNPYVQASLAPQLQLLNQQYGIQNVANQGQATAQGAYGGGRQAIMQGLTQQNQNLAQQQAIAQGYNTAFQQAQQAQQFGANLGLQGAQAGIQGAQDIYNQQVGILGLQNQMGAQQQQQQQNIINQAVQNYATAQQYPYQQLGFLSNMIQGLPVTQTSVQNYLATPNPVSQVAGLGTAGIAGYKLATGRTGGLPKDFKEKNMASGGIASGVPAAKLDYMLGSLPDAQLAQKANPAMNDPQTAQAAQSEEAFRSQMRAPGIGAAPAGQTTFNAAGGGIVAFDEGGQATAGNYSEPSASDYATNVASRAAALKELYGQNLAAQEFKQKLADIQASQSKENSDQAMWRLMQAGLGIAGGTSPFALTNIGQGAQPAVAGMMEDIKQQKKEQFDMAKAQYEVGNNDYKTNVEIANNASKDYNAELNRQMEMGKSQTQAAATIQAAQISAGASKYAADKDTREREAGVNTIKQGLLAQGYPDNANTDAIAFTRYKELGKPYGGASMINAETEALAKDQGLQSLYKQKKLLDFTGTDAEKAANDAKIAAAENAIRARVRGQAAQLNPGITGASTSNAAPAPGATTSTALPQFVWDPKQNKLVPSGQ